MTSTSSNTKAIFFDLDETLIKNKLPIQDVFANMYFDFENELGAGNKSIFFTELRQQTSTLWNSMFLSQQPPEDQFIDAFANSIRAIHTVAPTRCDELAFNMFDRFLTISASNVVPSAGALETLQSLRQNGFITGIITNGIERVQLSKIHALSLRKHVDHVIVSAQARAHKPDNRVFELALSKANICPSEAWQVGDHPENDVAGAIRAGMSGVFYDPDQNRLATAFDDLDERPCHTICDLRTTLPLLGIN